MRILNATGKYIVRTTDEGRLWLELESADNPLAALVGDAPIGLTLPAGAGIADAHELAFFLNKRGVGIAVGDS